jgi:hypothetical protein
VSGRFSRRLFLRASGAVLALPHLESLAPRLQGAQAAAEPPRRFLGMMTNMGILPEFFFPKTPGMDFESTPYLELLKDVRNELTVFSGVSLPGVDGGHRAEDSFLTGAPGGSSSSFKNSVSLDQVIAEQVGTETRFRSLTLGLGESTSLSWTRSGAMIPTIRSPLELYKKLFVEPTPEAAATAVRRLRADRSLLDDLHAEYRRLQANVSAADRDRLEQFAAGVREAEKRLAAQERWNGIAKPQVKYDQPEDITNMHDLPKNNRVMFDLVRLALETDSTRVITFCYSMAALSPKTIPGVKSECHSLTHHGQVPETIAELRLIEEAQFRELAVLLNALQETREQGVRLLDRTAVLYGTNMGSANAHSNNNLPVLLAGGGFKHAGHLAFDRERNYPLSNLYVSLLQRLGIETDRFSSGTATMRGLDFA